MSELLMRVVYCTNADTKSVNQKIYLINFVDSQVISNSSFFQGNNIDCSWIRRKRNVSRIEAERD